MIVGSLFSGIGGLELGLEQAGMKVKWQVEINSFCRRVLKKHWPDVTQYEDVKNVGAHNLKPVDLICGGVPCQSVSQAAARSERSGEWLWPEFRRIVNEMRPIYVLLENPESLRYARRGFAEILSDVAALGYNARWQVLPASAYGAPHRRARIWMVAYSNGNSESNFTFDDEVAILPEFSDLVRRWPDPPQNLRMDDGISDRMAQLRVFGNAVVPQVTEWIGQQIMEYESKSAK